MKKILVGLLSVMCLSMTAPSLMAQGSFAYQAVVRNAEGKFIGNTPVVIKIALSSESFVRYEEVQKVTTSAYGEVTVMVGEGEVTYGSFDDVTWSSLNVMMKVSMDVKGDGNFVDFAEMQIQPVPYALYAASTQPRTEIVAAAGTNPDEPLFSVKDSDGNLIFAVYSDGVRIFVDDTASADKARKSAFLVASRVAKDGVEENLFSVNGDGTQVYVDTDDTKARKSAFLVASRVAKDGESEQMFSVNADGTQVFIDDADAAKARKSAFLVASRVAKDGEPETLLAVNDNGTQVYVADSDDKARKSAFLVASRNAKGGESSEMFTVDADATKVYIDNDDDKARKSAFLVASRVAKDGESAEMFAVNDKGTQVYVDDSDDKARKSAFLVASRVAKDGEPDEMFSVDVDKTQVLIDNDDEKARKSAFLVASRVAKDDSPVEYLTITDQKISFGINETSGSGFAIVNVVNNEPMMSVTPEKVDFGARLHLNGINSKYAYDSLKDTLCIKVESSGTINSWLANYYYLDEFVNLTDKEWDLVKFFISDKSKDTLREYKYDHYGSTDKFVPLFDANKGGLGVEVNLSSDTNRYVTDSLNFSVYAPNDYTVKCLPVKFLVNTDAPSTLEKRKEMGGVATYEISINDTKMTMNRYFYKDDGSKKIYEYYFDEVANKHAWMANSSDTLTIPYKDGQLFYFSAYNVLSGNCMNELLYQVGRGLFNYNNYEEEWLVLRIRELLHLIDSVYDVNDVNLDEFVVSNIRVGDKEYKTNKVLYDDDDQLGSFMVDSYNGLVLNAEMLDFGYQQDEDYLIKIKCTNIEFGDTKYSIDDLDDLKNFVETKYDPTNFSNYEGQ